MVVCTPLNDPDSALQLLEVCFSVYKNAPKCAPAYSIIKTENYITPLFEAGISAVSLPWKDEHREANHLFVIGHVSSHG